MPHGTLAILLKGMGGDLVKTTLYTLPVTASLIQPRASLRLLVELRAQGDEYIFCAAPVGPRLCFANLEIPFLKRDREPTHLTALRCVLWCCLQIGPQLLLKTT